MSELENEIKSDKEFIEKVADRIYKDTDDWEEAIAEPEWIDRMTEIADRYIERFKVSRKLADKWLQSKQQPTLNENQQIVLDWLKENKMDNLFLTTARLHRGFLSGGVTSQVKSACGVLDLQQQAQVLQEFGKWVEEQEEEL